MKTIKSGYCPELTMDIDDEGDLFIKQAKDYLVIDKNQAKQLIEVLRDWVGDDL